ncbi:hypothetical protein QQ045_015675 [Rhodiola kirilowii]
MDDLASVVAGDISYDTENECVDSECSNKTVSTHSGGYNMIFVPFTGVDNHRRSVTLAAGLLSNENIDSYTWLLTCFKNLLSEQPNIIITDQDPTMKAAVAQVFDRSYHRFCMWHIAEKMKAKVGPLCNVNDFLKKISSVIWGHHNEPSDFEDGWDNVIREYNLENNNWLADMFDKRSSWIPVYSKHVIMGNLLRTTSHSESENSFFRRYIHHYMTFVEFYLGFRTAMKEQRKTRIQLDYENDTTSPPIKCPLKIAGHAAEIFTHKIFKETEIEIEAGVYKCSIEEILKDEDIRLYTIKETDQTRSSCQVSFAISTSNAVCSCNKFQSYGIICRHIFHVLNSNVVDKITKCLIMKRWCKEASDLSEKDTSMNSSSMVMQSSLVSEIWSQFRSIVQLVKDDEEKNEDFIGKYEECAWNVSVR